MTQSPQHPARQTLKEFLQANIPRGKLRQIAAKMGVSPSFLSALKNGKSAGPATCRRIADYFGVSLTDTLRMAGILDDDTFAPDSLTAQVVERIKHDQDLREILDHYLRLRSPADRRSARIMLVSFVQQVVQEKQR